MEKYFAELNELSDEAKNALAAGKSELSNGIKPRIALAMYGDMDAVFSCFLEETSTRHLKFETKKLEKLYKKLHKRIQKMDKADNVYKAKKCFSEEELQIPYISYKLALFCLQCNRPDWYLQHMQTAAAGGDPFAIYYCQSYYSTNSAEANPYGKNATTVKLNGAFDFDRMLYYAIRGIGIDSSAYYPNVPYISFSCICNHTDVMRKDTIERLYKTLTYFALPENIGTEEYKAHFGDFVPSPLQVKIARKWFFVDGDRLGLSSEMLTKRKLLRDQIAAAIEAEAAPQAAAKAKKETAKPKAAKTEDKKTTKTVDTAFGTVTVPAEAAANVPEAKKKSEAPKPAEKKSTAPAAPKTEYKRIEMSSGDVYEGGYANGEYHGQGTYTSRKGWVYVGAFDNGVMTDGKLTFTNSGNIFEGHFENGALHGKGKATYYVKVDGKQEYDGEYEGDWVKGKRHGKGKRVYYNGNVYDGDWKEDKRDGYGRFEHYTDKWQTKHFCDLVYEGRWQDDKKHGKGVEKHYMPGVNEDVTVYEGEWVNGKREGIFVWYLFYPATGKQSSKDMQYYRNGEIVIESIPYDASIKTYEDFAAAKRKLDAAAEERKRRKATSTETTAATAPASANSVKNDDILTEWEKIDCPADLLEMWKNPSSFTLDTDDRRIWDSCEYFDYYFHNPINSNSIKNCCEDGDCAGANEVLAELLDIPESVLCDAITEYREKIYGPQAYLYGYSVGEVIHSAILAAVQYGCHPAGIMNIAMYMYLHFDNMDELFLDALKCYEHGRGVDGCNYEEGIAALWFRRYMYHGDVAENLFEVEEHNHGEYENRWYIHLEAELYEKGKTMLSNGFMGNVTERPVYTDADFSTTQLIHRRLYTTGNCHVSKKRLPDGSIYSGPMTADGRPEGECTIDDPQGNHFSGYYHNGGYHGVTWIKYANGDEFAGYCCNGKKTGVGSMTWADGEKRLCIYKNDKPNGIGIYFPNYGKVRPSIYVNGEETYQKELEKKLRNAEYHTFEDSRYEGNVRYTRDGEVILEGYGTLYCNNGDVFSGLFRDDKLVEGFKYYKDELQLVYGSYDENGLPHGKATVLFVIDEKMYEGDFSHGEYEGRGKYQDYNGITYLCDWEFDSAVNILEVYDLDGKLIPRSKAPFLYDLGRLEYTRY